METIALHTVLRPDEVADYVRLHQRIPEEVAEALAQHGVHNWRIWRDGCDVFHLIEVEDYAAMRAGLRDLPANLAWQATVGPLFEVADDYAGADPVVGALWSLSEQRGEQPSASQPSGSLEG